MCSHPVGSKAKICGGGKSLSPPDKIGQKFIQWVNGKLLYLACAVDSMMLVALGNLASKQAKPTQETMRVARWLLNYATSNEMAVVTFCARNM